jgi:hypothetical protein
MAGTLEIVNSANLSLLLNKPCATMYQTATQSITNNLNTQITWSSASGDLWGGWSSGSNTRWTVPVAGWYKLEATIQWSANATNARHVEFYYNGSELINSLTIWSAPPGSVQYPQTANPVIVQANAGDYFQVNVYQNSGSAVSTATVSSWTVELLHF